MTTCNLQIEYPDQACVLDQDEEWINLVHDDGTERIRLHDYDRFYDVPGLYEEVVYNRLQCESPQVLTDLLDETLQKQGGSNGDLRILDFGAGNGIVGEYLQEMIGSSLNAYEKQHDCHRLSMAGEPLYYYAVIGRKENDF